MQLRYNDYVVATKYSDGDPGDQYCIGYYRKCFKVGRQIRYIVVDNLGISFRGNGFRRCQKISPQKGKWLVENITLIDTKLHSVWWYVKYCDLPNAIFRLKHKFKYSDDPIFED